MSENPPLTSTRVNSTVERELGEFAKRQMQREQKTVVAQILTVQLEHIMWWHVFSPFK